MIAKCANPECGKPFRYLRDGRLFAIPPPGKPKSPQVRRENRVKYAWLCRDCATTLTVLFETGSSETSVVPLEPTVTGDSPSSGGFWEIVR